MSRAQVHSIVGAPTTDSFDLKALDRWQIRSLFILRSLDVFYGYDTAPAGVAALVVIHNNSKLVYRDDFATPKSATR